MNDADSREVSVSVIVPAFNVEKSIERTLRSVMSQTLTSLELIVVDDGSTDGTSSRIRSTLSGAHVRCRVFRQDHKGVSVGRNRGLDMAVGRYVFFLDGDDTIESTCLSRLQQAIVSCSADAAFCGFDYVDEHGTRLGDYVGKFGYTKGAVRGRDALLMQLTDGIWIWTGSVLWRRSFLQEHGVRYTENCSFGEDQEFILKALFHARTVACVPETLAHYHRRSGSASRVVSPEGRMRTLQVFESLRDYFADRGADRLLISCFSRYTVPRLVASTFVALGLEGFTVEEISELLGPSVEALTDFRCPWALVGMKGLRPWSKIQALRLSPRLILAGYRLWRRWDRWAGN